MVFVSHWNKLKALPAKKLGNQSKGLCYALESDFSVTQVNTVCGLRV